jgi:hypothetical protein
MRAKNQLKDNHEELRKILLSLGGCKELRLVARIISLDIPGFGDRLTRRYTKLWPLIRASPVATRGLSMRVFGSRIWLAAFAFLLCVPCSSFGQRASFSNPNVAGLWASDFSTSLTVHHAAASMLNPYDDHHRHPNPQPMPEGGSPLIYLGLAIAVSVGVTVLASRRSENAERTAGR